MANIFVLFYLILFYLITVKCETSNLTEANPEESLFDYLFENDKYEYNPKIKAVVYDKDGKRAAVPVNVDFYLDNFLGVDHSVEVSTAFVYITESWQDPRLGWDPAEFDGIQKISVTSSEIWIPDSSVDNSLIINPDDKAYKGTAAIKTEPIKDNRNTNIEKWVGNVTLTYGALMQQRSPIEMTWYPFDRHTVTFCLASTTQTEDQLVFHASKIDKNGMTPSEAGQWSILNISASSGKYGDNFSCACISVTVIRKALYFLINLWFPTITICVMNTVGLFYRLDDSGAKLDLATLGQTTLLSLNVITLTVADQTPKGANTVSLIGTFFLLVIVQTLAATFMAMCYRERCIERCKLDKVISQNKLIKKKKCLKRGVWRLERIMMFMHLIFLTGISVALICLGFYLWL